MNSTDLALLRDFQGAKIAPGGFGHAAHVRVAWMYLQGLPASEASERFIRDLQNLVKSLGAVTKYHETITWAYLLLIRERWEKRDRSQPVSWEGFAAANRDLLERGDSLLLSYYRPETLGSELAKRIFLMPDRAVGAAEAASPGSA